jgi:hypothetical protein
LVQQRNLQSDNAGSRTCEHHTCLKPKFQAAKYCPGHLLSDPNVLGTARLDVEKVRASIDQIQWTYRPLFQEVIHRCGCIVKGKMPQGMLVCIDTEFSAASEKVFEIGVCEFESGKPLVDTRVKHHCSEDELHQFPNPLKANPYQRLISIRTSQRIYGTGPQNRMDVLDVHAIATKFREGGITPDSIILTWHRTAKDLELLRKLFDESGCKDYKNILPPKHHCMFMIPEFRRNMRIIPGILSLEIIFNLLFANHNLANKNHRALPDALQLRLMVKLFIELCKPLKERQLTMLPKSIDQYFPVLLQAKQEKELSLTAPQIKRREIFDRQDTELLNRSFPKLKQRMLKQRMLDASGTLVPLKSNPSNGIKSVTQLGKGAGRKRKATFDISLDQEPRPT